MKKLGAIIADHRKAHGMKQQDFADALQAYDIHVKKSAVSAWEKNISQPSASQLLAICHLLGITDIYSTFIEANPSDPMAGLNAAGRTKVQDYIDLLLHCPAYCSTPAAVLTFPPQRRLKVYCLPVSAGTGSFLDGEDYELMEVGGEVAADADFGVRVSGDSMEPQFINGQIVWIHQSQELSDGEIGIFCLNGDAYIKRLQHRDGHAALISLNRRYAPIEIREGDDFRTFGSVL